jgi:hypothetical protein
MAGAAIAMLAIGVGVMRTDTFSALVIQSLAIPLVIAAALYVHF